MDIYGAKFQEHCFNNFRDIVYSVFTTCQLYVVWHHHWSNLHNRKTSVSLKRKKIFQIEKRHSSVFWKAFQISRKKKLCHIHFKASQAHFCLQIILTCSANQFFARFDLNIHFQNLFPTDLRGINIILLLSSVWAKQYWLDFLQALVWKCNPMKGARRVIFLLWYFATR